MADRDGAARRSARRLRRPTVSSARPASPGPLRRLAPVSVRARATTAACAVVAAALAPASFALVALLHVNLLRTAEDGIRQQAEAVAQLAVQQRLTPLVPTAHGTDFIQVVDARGNVLAASQNLAGHPAITDPRPAGPGTAHTSWDLDPLGDAHRQRVATVIVGTPTGVVAVRAGTSLRAADAAEDTTTAGLAVACPLLLLVVGLVTWRVTGRALRPVEAIRAEVAEIGERALHRRVPLPRTDDEIARLAATMNAMLDRLDDAGQRQRQFIADASHELRSPLTVLRTQLEVAIAHPDPAVRAELLAGALEDTERLQNLATDLLLLARLDAAAPLAPQPGHPGRPVDLTGLVTAAARNRPADRRPVVLDLADGVRVRGNALWLTRLLTNLLDNAQRHTERTVRVVLRTGPGSGDCTDTGTGGDPEAGAGSGAAGGTVVLEVHDDGPGIAAADRDRVFERFTRLDDARSRDHGGAGLGLPIARDIAHHHGGTLVVAESAHGARLRLTLPRLPAGTGRSVGDPGGE
ncbi:sensor histidine kinase [Kitasatospora sp. NBC_00315]|uniref:sensor histidine kinase n=1 Tax=Kitasatospora sp. NBC_00315 TaxID=2975963 RepID=UPI0032538084